MGRTVTLATAMPSIGLVPVIIRYISVIKIISSPTGGVPERGEATGLGSHAKVARRSAWAC